MEDYKLFKGDCLDNLPLIPTASVDMIFADLPYATTKASWDSLIPIDKLWVEYERIIKDNGAIVLFAQTPFDKILGSSNLKLLRYEWIWEKTQPTGHLNAKKMPMKAHENILVFYKKLPTYNPQKTIGHERKVSTVIHKRNTDMGVLYGEAKNPVDYDSTERYPRSVLKFSSDKQKSNLHPTQKPAALNDYMIKTYTNEGDTVLDNCMGSGGSGKSAIKLGRKYIGMENGVCEKKGEYYNMHWVDAFEKEVKKLLV